MRPRPATIALALAARLLAAALGAGWLAAAAVTGQRYPGASVAWAAPAALGFALAAGGAAALARLAARLGDPAPWATAERVARPLWLAWPLGAVLALSAGANHYFVNWPRLRLAAALAVVALVATGAEWATLRGLERRYAALSRLRGRAGDGALVFGAALLLFLASAGGHLYTPDEWTIYAAAAGLANHGTPAAYADEPYPLHLLGGVRPPGEAQPDGTVERLYPKYGIVPSILAAPLYTVARITGPGPDLPRDAFPFENRALPLVPLLFNPLVTAATCALLYRLARDLRYARRAALVATLAFAVGSLAWPYAKTLLNMSLAAGLLLAAYWCLLRAATSDEGRATSDRQQATRSERPATSDRQQATRSERPAIGNRRRGASDESGSGCHRAGLAAQQGAAAGRVPPSSTLHPLPSTLWLLGGGAAAGLAVATRYEVALFVVPLAALCGWQLRQPAGRGLRALGLFALGLALVAGPLVFGFNALRTGSPLDAGYGGEGTFAALSPTPWYGLFGITLSPGCGLVPHTPLMALGLVALAWFWEDAPAPALAAGAIALLSLVYYGSLATTWCAFATWGPRYLLVVAPFMALPLAALWQRLDAGGRAGANAFVWLFGGGLLAWSAGTNLLAVLVDFNRGWQDHWAHGATYLETTWVPFFSGITSHFRLLREWLLDARGGLDLYLVYALGRLGWPALVVLLALALALLAAVWLPVPRPAAPPRGQRPEARG